MEIFVEISVKYFTSFFVFKKKFPLSEFPMIFFDRNNDHALDRGESTKDPVKRSQSESREGGRLLGVNLFHMTRCPLLPYQVSQTLPMTV